jgi:NAD(P)-dependent dehydrogenase (short-subunit alcohol dehydrogenase family)
MQQQTNRVVLITGAAGGLGPSVVRAYADNGAQLVLTSRALDELESLATKLELDRARTLLHPANVTDAAEVAALVRAARDQFGPIDVAVHVAGGFKGGRSVVDTDLQTWNFMLNLNLTSAFLLAHAVLPDMIERRSGKIVFLTSKGGGAATANQAAYAASKGGLEILVRDLAEETRQFGINVNAVSPSIIDTPANRTANPRADYSAWVQPASIAGVIHFLTSDAARDIHGAIVPVYGRA